MTTTMQTVTDGGELETLLLGGKSFAAVLERACGVELVSMAGEAPRAAASVEARTVRPGAR